MRKLLAFLAAKRHWILLIFCEIISFVLIYRNNEYQRNVMLSSANTVTGSLSSISKRIFSYFDLQRVNEQLMERNNLLEMEAIYLRAKIREIERDTVVFKRAFLKDTVINDSLYFKDSQYEYITANVVKNSTIRASNYITINKGYEDGIRPDMGVISPFGVTGIVKTVSKNFSSVISLLNPNFNIYCKLMNSHYFGPLSWDGADIRFAYMKELPTYAIFQIGDSVVTSGYSSIFPPGVLIGVVESFGKQRDDNFYSLKVRLATDFSSLSVLTVIRNKMQEEQLAVEREARTHD
jgi:rod shape-determining protein MreC